MSNDKEMMKQRLNCLVTAEQIIADWEALSDFERRESWENNFYRYARCRMGERQGPPEFYDE